MFGNKRSAGVGRTGAGLMVLVAAGGAGFAATAAAGGTTDAFTIGLEEAVSDGVPGPGAGNIEVAGATDVYSLDVAAGTEVYFDEVDGDCSILWSCVAPSGATIFPGGFMCSTDPGVRTLDEAGTYTITVYGLGSATGTYSFVVWALNPPEHFTIGLDETVSDGVPAPGAGNLEEPGAIDIFTLDLQAGTQVYFDELYGNCSVLWTCAAPSGATVFPDSFMCSTDPGAITVNETGPYTITVHGIGSVTGTYSFEVVTLNVPDHFTIGLEQMVALDQPGPGAGNIEEAGAIDIYALDLAAGTEVYFEELSGNCGLLWSCTTPGGATVFDAGTLCAVNPGSFTPLETGTHTIRVFGSGSSTGTYSFIVWEVNPPDEYPIAVDQVVSENVPGPGAGVIEEPGSSDIYTLDVAPETLVCFAELAGPCELDWECRAPDGSLVFTDDSLCVSNAGRHLLEAGGTYTITVHDPGGATGPYSFVVIPGRLADIVGDCVVDISDLLALLGSWGTPGADLDGDGTTGILDLLVLLADWG